MKKVHAVIMACLCIGFIIFACAPSQELIQATQQLETAAPTLTPEPTFTPKPIILTSTPVFMDTEYVVFMLTDGFKYSNKEYGEDMEALSASYEGGQVNQPTILILKIQDNSAEDHSGCLDPLSIISYGVLGNYPKTVFPASLENIRVECYTPTSYLLLSYQVTLEDLVDFASVRSIDLERVGVIKDNLSTFTPTPQLTAPQTPTQQNNDCSPAYPGVCIAPPPPDLDCKDIPFRRFKVLSPDPHKFDNDGNGIGCES